MKGHIRRCIRLFLEYLQARGTWELHRAGLITRLIVSLIGLTELSPFISRLTSPATGSY